MIYIPGIHPTVGLTWVDKSVKAMKKRAILVLSLFLLILSACTVKNQADQKFGDQHFKTTIALIELHKVRFGEYPNTLSDLKFTGDWDQMAINSVSYRLVDNGYELDIVRGWVGTPALQYPDEFWQGLGLVQSNAKPETDR